VLKVILGASGLVHVFLPHEDVMQCPAPEANVFGIEWTRVTDDAPVTCLFCFVRMVKREKEINGRQ